MCQSKTSPSFISRNRFPNVCNGAAENQMSEGIVLKGHTNGNAKRCHQQSIPFHSGTHSLLSHKYRSSTTITITRRQPSPKYCLDSVITTFRISNFVFRLWILLAHHTNSTHPAFVDSRIRNCTYILFWQIPRRSYLLRNVSFSKSSSSPSLRRKKRMCRPKRLAMPLVLILRSLFKCLPQAKEMPRHPGLSKCHTL